MTPLPALQKSWTAVLGLVGVGVAAYAAVTTYRGQQAIGGATESQPLPEFLNQLPDSLRFRELDARLGKERSVNLALAEVNSAQMVNYIWGGFQPSFSSLGIQPAVVGYSFELTVTPQQSITRALPNQDYLPSFIGAVIPEGDRVLELRCRSLEARRISLDPPVLDRDRLVCGPGSTPVAQLSSTPVTR